MKRPRTSVLTWFGFLLLISLLLLAGVEVSVGHKIETAAETLSKDSIAGVEASQAIRSAVAKDLTQLLCWCGTPPSALPEDVAPFTESSLSSIESSMTRYAGTMLTDYKTDETYFSKVRTALDAYRAQRGLVLKQLLHAPAVDVREKEAYLQKGQEVLVACDALSSYNREKSSNIERQMSDSILRLRYNVAAVVFLALVVGAVGAVVLDARKRADKEKQVTDEKFTKAFYSSPFPMVISSQDDGVIIEANEAFKGYYDRSGQNVVGMNTDQIGVWSTQEERRALVAALKRDGRVKNFKKVRSLPNGKKVVSLVSAEPLEIDGKKCMLSVAQDITELVEAEEALEKSLEQMRVIFEGTSIGTALVAPYGKIIQSNPALEAFLGYSKEELASMSFGEVTYHEDVGRDMELFARIRAGELSHYQLEKRYVRKDGQVRWGHLIVSVVRHADKSMAYGVGMVEDISDRVEAALALNESERKRQSLQAQLIVAQKLEALGQLAGGVAHDFNNILAAILLHLDLIEGAPHLSAEEKESISEVSKAARRAAGLTRQLLLFSRREPVQKKTVDLNLVITDLLRMLDRLVGEHYTLLHTGPETPLLLEADTGMLEQTVMNLVVNARDAMPNGGRITLHADTVVVPNETARGNGAAEGGTYVRLQVSDTGSGMTEATKSRLFEPFFTTKEAGRGTGLGLSTVFGIVQQHNGWIEVESSLGKGTAFTLYFPAKGSASIQPSTTVTPPLPHPGKERILLAEDNDAVRLVTARILRKGGYEVLEAHDGKEALELHEASDAHVDLLITDVVMPGGMLGHELAASLSKAQKPPLVIFMSGHTTQVDRSLVESQRHVYMPKPFTATLLLETVRRVLDGSPRETR